MQASRFLFAAALLAAPAAAFHASSARVSRAALRITSSNVRAGLFDGVKDAFAKPTAPTDADRITPIDRWLGIDKDLSAPKVVKTFVDPQDAANYRQVKLTKPMGIKFLENEGGSGGIVVDALLPDGSAATSGADIKGGDQLVGVDGKLVLGQEFEEALGAIQDSESSDVTLAFFRGSNEFLYGPTKPSEEWLRSEVLA